MREFVDGSDRQWEGKYELSLSVGIPPARPEPLNCPWSSSILLVSNHLWIPSSSNPWTTSLSCPSFSAGALTFHFKGRTQATSWSTPEPITTPATVFASKPTLSSSFHVSEERPSVQGNPVRHMLVPSLCLPGARRISILCSWLDSSLPYGVFSAVFKRSITEPQTTWRCNLGGGTQPPCPWHPRL